MEKLRNLSGSGADKLQRASERIKNATGSAADQVRDGSRKVADTISSAAIEGSKTGSGKIKDTASSVAGSIQDASKKASDATLAAAERVKTGSREALDAAVSVANGMLATTQGLLASSLSRDLTGLLENMVNGSATIYDKAMDAEYIATHIGGGNHRMFDGGHTIIGAIKAVRDASPDDSIIEEAMGLLQGWNRADTETFAKLVGSMGVSAVRGANPLLLIVTVAALAKAFHNAHQTGEYAEFVDGQIKGSIGAGATLVAVSQVGVRRHNPTTIARRRYRLTGIRRLNAARCHFG